MIPELNCFVRVIDTNLPSRSTKYMGTFLYVYFLDDMEVTNELGIEIEKKTLILADLDPND